MTVDESASGNPFEDELQNPFTEAEPTAMSTPETRKTSEPTNPFEEEEDEKMCNKDEESNVLKELLSKSDE